MRKVNSLESQIEKAILQNTPKSLQVSIPIKENATLKATIEQNTIALRELGEETKSLKVLVRSLYNQLVSLQMEEAGRYYTKG